MTSTKSAKKPKASTSLKPKPAKIEVSSHPSPCDCSKCGIEYCDCSEPERGTVPSKGEFWKQ